MRQEVVPEQALMLILEAVYDIIIEEGTSSLAEEVVA